MHLRNRAVLNSITCEPGCRAGKAAGSERCELRKSFFCCDVVCSKCQRSAFLAVKQVRFSEECAESRGVGGTALAWAGCPRVGRPAVAAQPVRSPAVMAVEFQYPA